MEAGKAIKATQEQAVASWVNYLNQLRIDRLLDTLKNEQENLEAAIGTINDTLKTITSDIVFNGKGRGGEKGMHGFIAEVAECGIGNARSQIEGNAPIYEWINDNGPEDLRRGAILIQQKFVQSGNHLSLQAVSKHLSVYPDFLENGGKYQIPADHYKKIEWLLSIPEEDANKMPTSTGEFSLKQWREVHEFFDNNNVPFDSLEPSALEYKEVQRDTYEHTLKTEEKSLKTRNQERREQAYEQSKPTVHEGAKAMAVAAVVEGGMTFVMSIVNKLKSGKKLRDLDEDDWKEIAGDSALGTVKGGVRGVSIYALTNYTATSAAVASSIVTASFGIAEQANRLRHGDLDELGLIENSEKLCLDASVSALSSFAGQMLIPVPILGLIIGNAVGIMMYQIARDHLSSREQRLIVGYLEEISGLGSSLQAQYQAYCNAMAENMALFMELLDQAFSPDVRVAFEGSVALAREIGVPEGEILDSQEKITSYFMD